MMLLFFKIQGHLSSQCRVSWPPFVLNSILVHPNIRATFQPTCPALIAMGFIYQAVPFGFGFAYILSISSNRSVKKMNEISLILVFLGTFKIDRLMDKHLKLIVEITISDFVSLYKYYTNIINVHIWWL